MCLKGLLTEAILKEILLLKIELLGSGELRTRNNYKAEILGSVCHCLRMGDSGDSPGEKKVRLASGGLGDEGHDDGEFKASLGYLVRLYLKNTEGVGIASTRDRRLCSTNQSLTHFNFQLTRALCQYLQPTGDQKSSFEG